MKTEKRQLGNRMGAAVLLLALVCANGYAQEENKSSNNNGGSKEEGNRNVMLNAATDLVKFRLVFLLRM